MKVRIGIDVGGTFTDAALIDNSTFELISTAKVPTTHDAEAGVAAGIVQVLNKVMKENHVAPEDVVFISHGTTQATNALLEGDVVKVGIVTLGKGIEGTKSRSDTTMGNIALTATKSLCSENEYVETGTGDFCENVGKAITALKEKGCTAIAACCQRTAGISLSRAAAFAAVLRPPAATGSCPPAWRPDRPPAPPPPSRQNLRSVLRTFLLCGYRKLCSSKAL